MTIGLVHVIKCRLPDCDRLDHHDQFFETLDDIYQIDLNDVDTLTPISIDFQSKK